MFGKAKSKNELLALQTQVVVDQFYCDDLEVNSVAPGENVKAKLKGIEEEDISPGFVLCDLNSPVRVGKIFDAQVSWKFITISTPRTNCCDSIILSKFGKLEITFSPGLKSPDLFKDFSYLRIFIFFLSILIYYSTIFLRNQVVILEHKSIICPGYSPVMHIHCAAEEVVVKVSNKYHSIIAPLFPLLS